MGRAGARGRNLLPQRPAEDLDGVLYGQRQILQLRCDPVYAGRVKNPAGSRASPMHDIRAYENSGVSGRQLWQNKACEEGRFIYLVGIS